MLSQSHERIQSQSQTHTHTRTHTFAKSLHSQRHQQRMRVNSLTHANSHRPRCTGSRGTPPTKAQTAPVLQAAARRCSRCRRQLPRAPRQHHGRLGALAFAGRGSGVERAGGGVPVWHAQTPPPEPALPARQRRAALPEPALPHHNYGCPLSGILTAVSWLVRSALKVIAPTSASSPATLGSARACIAAARIILTTVHLRHQCSAFPAACHAPLPRCLANCSSLAESRRRLKLHGLRGSAPTWRSPRTPESRRRLKFYGRSVTRQ